AGLNGVISSVHEAAMIRKELGKEFIIVTPGIRPKGYKADDQSRVATAEAAFSAGADFIVVGRPILEAADPLQAVKELV
ncbi:MAG: orotidine 5'-phosphate decarboxylase, partial [Candidatus Omnitrophica bacterium]|nr:orotidine 5'-phosphate decarboxylase [Candidatus Omnitrophota bacterium]